MTRPASPSERSSKLRLTVVSGNSHRGARWLGAALIGLQAVILGHLSGARFFPAMILVLACGAGATRFRIQIDRMLLQLLCVVIAVGFWMYYTVFPFPFPIDIQFIRTPQAHTVARFLICMQLLALVIHREFDRPPPWLAGLGAICLPFAANVQVSESEHQTLVLWIVTFVAVAALYCSQARRCVKGVSQQRWARALTLMTVLAGAMFLGSQGAAALRNYEGHIEWFLQDYLGYGPSTAQSGFSASGRLTDVFAWKTFDANRVAMRVFSDREPGYLRGRAFDTYRRPEWENSWAAWTTNLSMRQLPPIRSVRGLPGVRKGDRVYQLDRAANGPWTTLEIWPEPQLGKHLFSLLKTAYLAIDHGHVTCDVHGNLLTGNSERFLRYSIIVPVTSPQVELRDDLQTLLTSTGLEIDPFVIDLANQLFTDCRTSREKINRVQQWFRDNFDYKLGISIPRGEDPLTYFLKERPPAHCEFFATGTAVLLRLGDVPSRYVTGYVVSEKNDLGGYWLARNKDAHAWVEAYDKESRQWVIVESMPAAGIPAPSEDPLRSQFKDSMHQWWKMAKRSLRTVGVGGLLINLAKLFWSIPGLVLLLLVAGGLLFRKLPLLPKSGKRRTDPRLKSIHTVLKQLDRRAKRHGFDRDAEETLIQFAGRIRCSNSNPRWQSAVADCYELYATLRFRGQTNTDSVERLRQAISEIPEHSQTQAVEPELSELSAGT